MQYAFNPRRRYEERSRRQSTQFFITVALIALAFTLGLWIGREYAAAQLKSYDKQTKTQDDEIQTLQDDNTKLNGDLRAAQLRLEQLQLQMEAELPAEGPLREVIDLARKQLDAGLAPDRLAFVIRSARPPRNCTEPQSKRFVVVTPAYQGPDTQVSVGEAGVLISAKGMSAINAAGQPEAWFDPAKPVSLTFKTLDGQSEAKSGPLPLQHTVVASGREYRFTIAEGEKSFAKITFDSCEYP
jgi:hypothetical protein